MIGIDRSIQSHQIFSVKYQLKLHMPELKSETWLYVYMYVYEYVCVSLDDAPKKTIKYWDQPLTKSKEILLMCIKSS